MSLFGSLMGDFEDDPIFGQHMRSMRQMNSMMNSIFSDPFGMLSPFDAMGGGMAGPSALTGGFQHQQMQHRQNAMMPFGFPPMPNMNRLLSGEMPEMDGASFCSSRVVTMVQGPDGRPQVYQASSSTKTGPGGIRETQKSVQDSRTGLKKMAIGHHIGERAHVIEREQNVRTGVQEERQDFINLDEDDAEDFDREFTQRSRNVNIMSIGNGVAPGNGGGRRQNPMPAIMPAPNAGSHNATTTSTTATNTSSSASNTRPQTTTSPIATSTTNLPNHRRGLNRNVIASPRRPLRTPTSSPLTMSNNGFTSSRSSIHPHPYNSTTRRGHRSMKGKSQPQPAHHVQIEELPPDYDEDEEHQNAARTQ